MDAVREPRAADSAGARTSVGRWLHLAVISAGSGVLATFADWSSAGVLVRLRHYVEEHAPVTLWPSSARRVLDLLDAGEIEAAIKLYFAETGGRWDKEQLYQDLLEID